MMNLKFEHDAGQQYTRRTLTMAEYIRRRNGVPAGARGALRNMLVRSFGAKSFAVFWQHWNPIFGYSLGRYVYSPLKRVLPPVAALILTFVVCGAFHDLVTSAVRGSGALLFTPWFLFLGIGVVVGRSIRMDLSRYSWRVRAVVNLAYFAVCLALAIFVGISWWGA